MYSSNGIKRSGNTKHRDITELSTWLYKIDPDVHYEEWFRALAAIHYETNGSEEGLELANAWSSNGSKYRNSQEVRRMWRGLRSDLKKPITIKSLIRIAQMHPA